MNYLLIAAFAPAVFLLHFVYVRDKYEREPLLRVLHIYLLGFLTVIPAAIYETILMGEDDTTLTGLAFSVWGVIALSEELAKYLLLHFMVVNHKSFDEVYDGILYGVAVSLGFATAENLMYVLGAETGGAGTAIMRALLAVPGHALWGVMMGYFIGLAKFEPRRSRKRMLVLIGLLLAIFWHGLYDYFAFGVALVPESLALWYALGIPLTIVACWIIALNLLRRAQVLSVYRKPSPMVNPIAALQHGQYCTRCGLRLDGGAFCIRCGQRRS